MKKQTINRTLPVSKNKVQVQVLKDEVIIMNMDDEMPWDKLCKADQDAVKGIFLDVLQTMFKKPSIQ